MEKLELLLISVTLLILFILFLLYPKAIEGVVTIFGLNI